MSGIVLLAGQVAITICSFLGIAAAIGWYHSEGGKKNDKSNSHTVPSKNIR